MWILMATTRSITGFPTKPQQLMSDSAEHLKWMQEALAMVGLPIHSLSPPAFSSVSNKPRPKRLLLPAKFLWAVSS
jgi:hypothetical protein